MANWLNTFFANFDYAIIEFFHNIVASAPKIFVPICQILDSIGDMPLLLLGWLGLLFFFIKKDKKCGMMMIGSIMIGAIITSLVIKKIVYRPRPYMSDIEMYKTWWQLAGAELESETSFPSGHTTAAMAGILGYFLWSDKKWPKCLVFLYPLIMGISRICLVVHYPSDILGGLIVGTLSSYLCLLIVNLLYKLFNKYPDFVLFRYFLTGSFKKQITE